MLHDRNALFRTIGQGAIENSYNVKLVNKTDADMLLSLRTETELPLRMLGKPSVTLAPNEVFSLPLTLRAERGAVHGRQPIAVAVVDAQGKVAGPRQHPLLCSGIAMNSASHEAPTMAWYRVPEVWLMLVLLGAMVIGSFALLSSAIRTPDTAHRGAERRAATEPHPADPARPDQRGGETDGARAGVVNATACFHCGEANPASPVILARVQGRERAVCCPGCQAAAEWIDTLGLGDYYRLRSEPALRSDIGFDYSAWDRPALRRLHVRETAPDRAEVIVLVEACAVRPAPG